MSGRGNPKLGKSAKSLILAGHLPKPSSTFTGIKSTCVSLKIHKILLLSYQRLPVHQSHSDIINLHPRPCDAPRNHFTETQSLTPERATLAGRTFFSMMKPQAVPGSGGGWGVGRERRRTGMCSIYANNLSSWRCRIFGNRAFSVTAMTPVNPLPRHLWTSLRTLETSSFVVSDVFLTFSCPVSGFFIPCPWLT